MIKDVPVLRFHQVVIIHFWQPKFLFKSDILRKTARDIWNCLMRLNEIGTHECEIIKFTLIVELKWKFSRWRNFNERN